MNNDLFVYHLECKKGRATIYGSINQNIFKKSLLNFLEDLERKGQLEAELKQVKQRK